MSKFTSARAGQSVSHGWHLLRNRKTMWQMIGDALHGRYKMSMLTVIIAIVAVAYIIFPFDFIPDYIPVIGWIDDVVVFYLLLWRLVWETHRYIRVKAMERKN